MYSLIQPLVLTTAMVVELVLLMEAANVDINTLEKPVNIVIFDSHFILTLSALLPMGNNYPYFGAVTANSWNYYSFSVSSTSSLNVVLKETYTSGSIYVSLYTHVG